MPWGVQQGATAGRANFSGGGTMPVDSYEFGMSPYGCFNMAGNAAEWLLNETSGSFFTGGGSWGDLPYLFGYYGTYPGLYSSNKLGFRCVLNLPGAGGDQGAMKLRLEDEAPSYTPASESTMNSLLHYYEYERTPLDAQVTEVLETDVWRRERISYSGADGERAIAYLYLPKNFQAPYQVIHYMPAGDVFNRARSLPDSTEAVLSPFIKSGRAVFAVVFRGFIQRDHPTDYREHSPETVEFVEDTARNIIDARRGLDYLETRGDIDASKISYFTFSSFDYKVILPAVEPRYRAVICRAAALIVS